MRSPIRNSLMSSRSSICCPHEFICNGWLTLVGRATSDGSCRRRAVIDQTRPLAKHQYLRAVFLHWSSAADNRQLMPQIARLFDTFCLHYRSYFLRIPWIVRGCNARRALSLLGSREHTSPMNAQNRGSARLDRFGEKLIRWDEQAVLRWMRYALNDRRARSIKKRRPAIENVAL